MGVCYYLEIPEAMFTLANVNPKGGATIMRSHDVLPSACLAMSIVIVVTLFCSCHNRTSSESGASNEIVEELVETCITLTDESDTIRHSNLKYFDFDTIDDLQGCFSTLAADYPIAKWMGDEDTIDETVADCIAEIDAYRKGSRSDYPDIQVRDCIRSMGFNIAAMSNHSSEMTDLALAEWVMMCAAFYSPDITCLVEKQTPDHRAGFYNLGESYNPGPWWSYLFVKRDKGYEVICLGDFVKVHSISQISDEQNRIYYLCTGENDAIGDDQWMFWAKDSDTYVKVTSPEDSRIDLFDGLKELGLIE